eukprot:gene1258-2435_t
MSNTEFAPGLVSGLSIKFSREDEQILALNYENLCDGDYLNRLFSTEVRQSEQEERQQAQHGWLITEDIAEDILLFGDADELGREFLLKKSLNDVPVTELNEWEVTGTSFNDFFSKNSRPNSSASPNKRISRQVRIFEHIARVVLDRCLTPSQSSIKSLKDKNDKVKTTSSPKHLVSSSLTCILRVLEKNSRNTVHISSIQPILSLVIQTFQQSSITSISPSLYSPQHAYLTPEQFQYLRNILSNGVIQGINNSDNSYEHPKESLDSLHLSLTCTYSLLSIGLYSKNIGDIIISILQLLAIHIRSDERQLELSNEHPTTTGLEVLITEKEKMRLKAKLIENNKSNTKFPLMNSISNNCDDIELRDSRNSNNHDGKIIPIKKWDKSINKIDKETKSKLQIVRVRSTYENDDNNNNNNNNNNNSNNNNSVLPGAITSARRKSQSLLQGMDITSAAVAVAITTNNNSNNNNNNKLTSNQVTQVIKLLPSQPIENHTRKTRSAIENMLQIPKRILKIIHKTSSPPPLTSTSNKNSNAMKSSATTTTATATSALCPSEIWTCGQNSYGELGHGDVTQRRSFSKVLCMEGRNVISIGAGNEHSVFITKEGALYVSGYNDNGQCGIGTTHQVRIPAVVPSLEGEEITQVHVYNGCEHTLLITKDGKLYSFGYNYRGQLGLGSTTSESTPRAVRSLLSKKVITAACSYHHSVVLTTDGAIYTFGRNDCGQLGHGDNIDRKTPHLVTNHPKNVLALSCGQFHSVIVTKTGTVFSCGKNDYGQLGLEGIELAKTYTKVFGAPESEAISQVCCGYYHTLLLSQNGVVYGFGRNDYGQLGLGHTQPRIYGCHAITALRDKNVTAISAGCYHSIAITSNGMLYVFGRNNHGQLGTGDTEERHLPHPVDDFVGRRIISIAAGFYHTVVLSMEHKAPFEMLQLSSCHTANAMAVLDAISANDEVIRGDVLSVDNAEENPCDNADVKTSSTATGTSMTSSTVPCDIPENILLGSRSNISIRELILPLLERLRNLGQQSPSSSSTTSAAAASVSASASDPQEAWLACQLRSLTLLMGLVRRFIRHGNGERDSNGDSNGNGDEVRLPFSDSESARILHTLISITDIFLGSNSNILVNNIENNIHSTNENENNENDNDIFEDSNFNSNSNDNGFSYDDTSSSIRIFSAASLIKELYNKSNIDNISTPSQSNIDLRNNNDIMESLDGLRRELVCAYFIVSNDTEHSITNTNIISIEASNVICKYFDILFISAKSKSQFFTLLASNLTKMKTVEQPSSSSSHAQLQNGSSSQMNLNTGPSSTSRLDHSKCLHLFTTIFFKFRRMDEVINLFRTSKKHGLIIFQQLLVVYSHISMICLENKLLQTSTTSSTNIQLQPHVSHSVSALEHCSANFAKCAIPLILSTYEEDDEMIYSLGLLIIQQIFSTAETVLDHVSTSTSTSTSSSTSTQSQALSEDVFSILRFGTVLPSVLPTLLLYAISFISTKGIVQDILPYMDATDASSTSSSMLLLSMQKKDIGLNTWWSRLLKFSVILSSKIASVLISDNIESIHIKTKVSNSITSTNNTPSSSSGTNNVSSGTDIFDDNLLHHKLWKYCYGPSSMKDFISFEKFSSISTSTPLLLLLNDRIIHCCKVLRDRENVFNHTYRVVWQSAKSSGTLNLVEDIEKMIMDVVFHVEGVNTILPCKSVTDEISRFRLRPLWSAVTGVTKLIQSQRSQLVTHGTLPWKEVLLLLHSVVNASRHLLNACLPKIITCAPLPRARKWISQFRRSVYVIICCIRMKSFRRTGVRKQGEAVVDFMSQILQHVVFSLPHVTVEAVEDRWKDFITSLSSGNEKSLRLIRGVSVMGDLLHDIHFPTMKADVISALTLSWRDQLHERLIQIELKNSLKTRDMNTNMSTVTMRRCYPLVAAPVCCDVDTHREKSLVLEDLIQALQNLIGEFVETSKDLASVGQSELTVISFAVKYLELISSEMNVKGLFHAFRILPQLQRLLVLLDERLVDTQTTDDRGASRRIQAKEKLKTVRRTSSAIISLIQMMSIRMSGLGVDSRLGTISSLLLAHAQMLSYFQRSRLAAASSVDAELRGRLAGSPPTNSKDGKKNNKDKDANANNHRRRCQELISQPLQFVRGQEGFVIQGEKLLSNYKGIDFTLSVWIYLSKKSSLRYSFITGKVSHNDAWPLVVLRGSDSKLDIIYGRGNEFERFTTQGTIPLYKWTHIVLVTEPRKIKVFMDGNMDTQANTPGNARAILYPVIIGSCPQGVRTRVDHVRDGFEGLLSNFKYYTRALSPIHVRVMFDQGAPEAHDIREKWTYQLLSSCKSIIDMNASVTTPSVYRRIADVLHLIFVTDTGRLRNASLRILERILLLDILDDITLSPNSLNNLSATSVMPASIMPDVSIVGATFLSEYSSFRERLVLYFIRMIGCCWAPALATSTEDGAGGCDSKPFPKHQLNDRMVELFNYCPLFIGERVNACRPSVSGPGSCVIDKSATREELAAEMCQLLVGMLRNLASKERWKDSISSIVYRSLCKFRGAVDVRREWTPLLVIDILGASVFLGEVPAGAFVGGLVESYFSETVSRVLNIDKTTNHATLLSYSALSNSRQLLVVRVSDLSGYSPPKDALVLREFVTHSMLDLMDSLRPFVQLLLSDLVCVYRPDHPFLRHTMLKALRPMEVFIFYQMMRHLTRSSCIMPSELRLRQALFHTFLQFCSRTVRLQTPSEDNAAERAIPSLWGKCSRHLSSMTERVIVSEFPPADGERFFVDYATKHLGIVGDAFLNPQNTKLMKGGMLSELLFCLANQHSDLSSLRILPDACVLNDSGSSGELNENDAACTLRLVYHLRRSIIQLSRNLLMIPLVDEVTYTSLRAPWQMLLWQCVAQIRSTQSPAMITKLMWNMNMRLHSTVRVEVTHCLASTLRYAAISFFQLVASKTSGNIIESTDLFSRIMHAAYSWISFHIGDIYEIDVCFQFLKMLLPSLNFVESSTIELHILQLCRQALHRIITRLIAGQEPSKELLELARTNNFNVLWTRAQDQLYRERGNSGFRVSALAQNLSQLAVGLQIIQRCSGYQSKNFKSMVNSGNVFTTLIPTSPKVVVVRATFIELDLHACLSKFEGLGDGVILEVAMGVILDGEPDLFETIYRGSSSRLTQSGLSPRCSYAVRCRAILGSHCSKWSSQSDFDTELGNIFHFDPLKCGPDILLSDDGLTASYTGDDCWSTVLGTQAVTCGVCSWELRVTQSSTAYIFVGVARSSADLHTFLGGCGNGWGFIGEQALYHNREKVKVYGDAFSSGDIIGVLLDLNNGTLSFTRNGKTLGVAFDKIYGELFPAVAFYNVGQEVEIVVEGCHTSCPHEPIPCSPSRVNMDELCLLTDFLYGINNRTPVPHRVLEVVAEQCTAWTNGSLVRKRAISGRGIYLCTKSPLLRSLGLRVGERLRTPYGVAEIAGSAYGRIWFSLSESRQHVWFFSSQQVLVGREKGLFQRCSYEKGDVTTDTVDSDSAGAFDVAAMYELLDSSKWTDDMDGALVRFLLDCADKKNVSPWDITADEVRTEFRTLQQYLSRIVIANADLSHRWGISGPKRKAVLGRLALLRELNHLLEPSLAITLLDTPLDAITIEKRLFDEFVPIISTLTTGCPSTCNDFNSELSGATIVTNDPFLLSNSTRRFGQIVWPRILLSWMPMESDATVSTLLPTSRHRIFTELKMKHFWEILSHSTVKAHKTDDDYDYPDDLPQVKLNRFKSFRARESSELNKISGEDFLFSSMFCQLWKELRQHPQEKLRISYTHPMDDGQSRTFKVRFENEGVDDYGGPYREVFQQLCEELQAADPSQDGVRCFLPLLCPTPNWTAGDLRLDLYRFLGQLVGIAIRSKITFDIQLPSVIWKAVVREPLTEHDIASFDAPAADFVSHIASLYKRLGSSGESVEALALVKEEVQSVIQDLNWTARRSDGRLIELIPGGAKKSVVLDELGLYLKLYVEARLSEGEVAVEAFRDGLLSVIPENAITLLTWEEMQKLVCGVRYIDVERLRANTEYDDDVTAEDSHIVAFWDVLRSFSEEEKSSFLRFVWARPTLPPKGVEFPQKLKIQSAVGDDATLKPDQYLPKAHTCFFSINLPRYSCKQIVEDRLKYAITNCTEMDADFRLTETEVTGWNNSNSQTNMSRMPPSE